MEEWAHVLAELAITDKERAEDITLGWFHTGKKIWARWGEIEDTGINGIQMIKDKREDGPTKKGKQGGSRR